jgi:two-component system NtrC family sensor kinase
VTDAENRVSLLNPAAETLLGDVAHADLWTRVVPRDPTVPAQAAEKLKNEAVWRAEIEVDGPNARGLLCKITAVPVPDSGIGRTDRLWIFEDVTEMRTLQKQTVEQYGLAKKGEMAGEIAHELNNYLTILSGNAELLPLRLKANDPPAVQRTLASIHHAITQMSVFTDSLLRSRHPSGQRARIDLNEFLSNQASFLRPQKRFKKMAIKTDSEQGLPALECDPSGLQQVIYNLLLNASDALTEARTANPTVFMSAHYEAGKGEVSLTVADNGRGIPPEVMPLLFRERTTSKPTGHGFGMLTVRRIVQEHGGRIIARERAGGGAEFVITLPIDSASPAKE